MNVNVSRYLPNKMIGRTEARYFKAVLWILKNAALSAMFGLCVIIIARGKYGQGLIPALATSLAILSYAIYRVLYKAEPRRCTECKKKGLLHGWFVWEHFTRTSPPPDPRFKDDTTVETTHFLYRCLTCSEIYPVREPDTRSFETRPILFKKW